MEMMVDFSAALSSLEVEEYSLFLFNLEYR